MQTVSYDQLIEKWAPVLNEESAGTIQDHHRKAVTAAILENQERAFAEEAAQGHSEHAGRSDQCPRRRGVQPYQGLVAGCGEDRQVCRLGCAPHGGDPRAARSGTLIMSCVRLGVVCRPAARASAAAVPRLPQQEEAFQEQDG